ncbi:TAXI family TRAP transporter solute-binding subunit [Desertibaculum subflavum]|uniref:TAXI family TRAP transporter solute-binding subunit n=1 Tax=Desertibaculum subflavum TaxID=2268458 RepID=UPI000E66E4C1
MTTSGGNLPRVAAVLAFAVSTLAGAGLAQAQQKVEVIFSAGPTGGSWTPLAASVSQVVNTRAPDLSVQVEPGAALVNMEKIRNDKADIGWSMTTVMADARKGEGQFVGKATDKGLYVANFYPNVWQMVVPADSGIKSVKDLKGKPVALPARGNTSLAAGWEYVLKANGMTLNDLGPKSYGPVSANAEAVKNRQAMAAGWFTVVPASFVMDLGSAMQLRMLEVTDAEFAELKKLNAGFVRHKVKAGTYKDQGIAGEVNTFQSPTVLIASSKASADVVYKLTKAIIEGREEFANVVPIMKGITPAEMAVDIGMPYHPGAEKYYKEAGLLKK